MNKLIDVSIASNRNSGKAETNILEHDKKNNNKSKYNNEKDDINDQIMKFKITLKMIKSIIHLKRTSQMMKMFMKYRRRKPE